MQPPNNPPIPGSNWLVENKVLTGESPDMETIRELINFGVTTFVSLMTEEEYTAYGDYRSLARLHGCTVLEFPVEDGHTFVMKGLEDAVVKVCEVVRENDTTTPEVGEKVCPSLVYIHCYGGHGRSGVLGACFLQAYLRIDPEESINLLRKAHLTRGKLSKVATPQTPSQLIQIRAYRRPWNIIICGDRHSSVTFSDFILSELKKLPRHSFVMVGDCKGVDQNATNLCKELGVQVKVFQASWSKEGMAAGPKRNKEMLDASPDCVFAFHPDITESKGTLNMITQALLRKLPVWLHDTKRSRLIRKLDDIEAWAGAEDSH